MALSMETQLQSIFEDVVKTEMIEEAFAGMFMDTPEDERTKLISCLGAFRQYWGTLPQESHDQCVQWIVRFTHSQHSPKRISFLYDCLAMAVETSLLPPRMVCVALISSDSLEWERSQLWALTFKLIRKIIGGVDYKGVRDLLKAVLDKIQSIPTTVSSAVVQQLLVAREVVEYILDRNACLLPAYFAITEIRKLYPEGQLSHWLLGSLISDFVDSFRPTSRINSICGRCSLLPVVNNSGAICNSWKLDPNTLRFPLRGMLPYDKDLFEPQTGLLRYVLEQPYSREMVCNMLGLNKQHKQRCPVLEEQLVDLVVYAMERSETEEHFDADVGGTSQLLWQHLSSQLIFFVLFQFASFPHMVLSLHQKLAGRGLIKGRDHLMWVLLQFISGSIQKNALADFLPVMKLFDLLYPEKECIPVPDINKPQSTHSFAMTCIWIHLNRKAQNDNSKLQIPIPHSLKLHHEFLQQSLRNKSLGMLDYKIALLCNAYSTNSECFTLPMGVLVETIYGNGSMRINLPGTNCTASGSVSPLPMNLLDSLTVHAKMSLIHSIATRVIKLAHAKSSIALAPALVETYSRLLVYMEIESLGIKGFISQLLPNVFKSHAWGILHTLLEMFSYRMHHIQPHYRVQLLSHLHSLAAVPQTNQNQLHLCVESTALRLITALGSSEVQPQFTRFLNDPKTVLSAESEELNRALILTLARATHITGSYSPLILARATHITGSYSPLILARATHITGSYSPLILARATHITGSYSPLILTLARATHITGSYSPLILARATHITGSYSPLILARATHITGSYSPLILARATHITGSYSPLILTLARATHITDFFTGSDSIQGTWCKDILQTIMTFTPHNWASHTLSCFPAPLQAFFKQNNVPQESRFNLKKNVEEEYRKWKSMSNENDIITHFSLQGSPPLFLCLLWKMLLETDHINQIGFRDGKPQLKVLERIGARALVAHVRTFADFLVYEFSTSAGGQQLNKCIEILNDMVWKYNIVTLDRLILCLAMRSHEGNEAQVCYFIIQLLLLKPNDFRNRVNDFVKENAPEHWLQNDWHSKHMSYHKKYPEKLYFEGLADQVNPPMQHTSQYLPIYFGNVCLRFLPVFDIVIHRFLELIPVSKSLETLLDHLGGLYKFHDRPVTYLYNTLHYYERHLRERTSLKRKLVHAIMSSLKDNRTPGWCLSETYIKFGMSAREDNVWIPDDTYYCKLIGRLVDTMAGKSPGPFPNCDWRFNEFPNPAAHALHVTCVELMALTVPGKDVGNALLNVVLRSQPLVPRENITAWMNAIGLVITALPEPYWIVLHDRIVSVMGSPTLTTETAWAGCPFALLDFTACHQSYSEMNCSYVLALAHAVWHHSSIGQLSLIPKFLSETLKPVVQTEFQLLYVYHLVGPFLQRFQQERTRCMLEIGVAFYEMLQAVDQHSQHLHFMDPICDFLYHIKYMYTGDSVKEQVEKIIMTLRPAMKLRLRFITHSSKIETSSAAPPSSSSTTTTTSSSSAQPPTSSISVSSPSSTQHTPMSVG
ncbi:mediator of RNA polymerase II transcription subunit 23 isoform X2 [Gadus macrocephalus]|uniref:mediator of RNA polymerase II transcription subunit 23 isoform X2 n=1 Tax=Gadus macrocephalus TaxID=80720 RepID=UPI0028CB1C0D|nr:mediator of RNA polymerase II transcription subunit 23 isoform X2 [Gadus macrocephalus]